MEDLAFIYADDANVADFLIGWYFLFLALPKLIDFSLGVTVLTERKIRPDYEVKFPRTAKAILTEYQAFIIKKDMMAKYKYLTT